MATGTIAHPRIVPRGAGLTERKELLAHEKEITQQCDRAQTIKSSCR
jgi:hypothetical protein